MIEFRIQKLILQGFLLVTVAATWLGGIFLDSLLPLPALSLLIGAIGAFLCIIPLRHNTQGRLVMLLIGCALLGAMRYSSVFPAYDPQAISNFIGHTSVTIRGAVVDEPKLQGRLRVLLVDAQSISHDGGTSWQDTHGHFTVQSLGALIEDPYAANYGDSIELKGKLQAPTGPHAPDIFASMAFPRIHISRNGGNIVLAYLYHLRVSLATIITQALPQPAAALLIALVLSLRTATLKPYVSLFNVTGTAHLIAPSGFKVTVAAKLVASSMSWLYKIPNSKKRPLRLLPAQQRRDWRRWLTIGLVITFICIYTILSGAVPAALRAGMMGIIVATAPLMGRNYNVLTALALVAVILSVLDPFVLWDVGFLLSFLGTLGIVLFTPFFQRLLHPLERVPFSAHLIEIVAVTLAAEMGTLPIFAIAFQQISFIAPLTNILTVPFLSIVLVLGSILCIVGLFSLPLATLCGWALYPLLQYLLFIVGWCASVPGAYTVASTITTNMGWGYYGLLVFLSRSIQRFIVKVLQLHTPIQQAIAPSLSRRTIRIIQVSVALLIILATGTTALAAQPDGRLTITFFDVGPAGQPPQGEAIFVRTPDGKTALIDGGLDAVSLSQALDSHLLSWQRSLDMVFLTTPLADHLTGLQDIVTRYQIGTIIDAGMLHPSAAYALWRRTIEERHLAYQQVSQGATIALGTQVLFQVLNPPSQLHKGSDEARNNGLILRLVSSTLSVLFLGATAQSKYALNTLHDTIGSNYLHAQIVHIVGEVGKDFPSELADVLHIAEPAWIVVTPPALSAKQRKEQGITTILPLTFGILSGTNWQVMQTAQIGSVVITRDSTDWNVNTP